MSLYIADLSISYNWSEAVDWSEIFNGFTKNALSNGFDYHLNEHTMFNYAKDDTKENQTPTLHMFLTDRFGDSKKYSFSKLECMQIYSKLSKILSKCDLVSQGY